MIDGLRVALETGRSQCQGNRAAALWSTLDGIFAEC